MTPPNSRVFSKTFEGTPASVKSARRWTQELLQKTGLHGQGADDAVTCVSELATNAVLHSRSGLPSGTYRITVALHPGAVDIEVTDQGGEQSPHISRPIEPDDREGGRGLEICSRLGAVDHAVTNDGHCRVWVRLPHSQVASAPDPLSEQHMRPGPPLPVPMSAGVQAGPGFRAWRPCLPPCWTVQAAGCAVTALPDDLAIAPVARGRASDLFALLEIPGDLADDLVLAVSELATNAIQHATRAPARPEMWIYPRRHRNGCELAVKLFDASPRWGTRSCGETLHEHGRGLAIVNALTDGRWGHHLTRSRLAAPVTPGKATWCAMPIPQIPAMWTAQPAHGADGLHRISEDLSTRGIDHTAQLADPKTAEIVIRGLTTITCDGDQITWSTGNGHSAHAPAEEITDVCEQVVRLHEETRGKHS